MKLFKIIFGIIGGLILLLIAIAAVLIILIYDNSHKINQDIIDANAPVEKVIGSLNYDALETANDGKLTYGFNEYKMNELLYALTKDIKLDPIETNGFGTIYNSDGSLTVYAPAKFGFFNTCLMATLAVEDTDVDITLKIKEIKLGKLSTSWFGFIIDKAIDTKAIENTINTNTHLDVTVTYENRELGITLKNETFYKLIGNNVSDDNGLYSTLINIIKETRSLYDIDFSSERKGFVVDLTNLKDEISSDYSLENKVITKYGDSIDNKIINEVQKLTKDNKLSRNEGETVINFLIRGYDNLTESEQVLIEQLDLSLLGFEDTSSKQNFEGYYVRNENRLTSADIDAKVSAINPDPTNPTFDVIITNNELNSILDKQAFLGKTFAIYNDNNEINYIMVSNAYIEVSENKIKFVAVLDLNGNELPITMIFNSTEPGVDYVVEGEIESIKMGQMLLVNQNAASIIAYLATNLDNDTLLEVDPATNKAKLNVYELFSGSNVINSLRIVNPLIKNKATLTNEGLKISYYI